MKRFQNDIAMESEQFNQFNNKRIQGKKFNTLNGMILGIVADGKLNQYELDALLDCMDELRFAKNKVVNNLWKKINSSDGLANIYKVLKIYSKGVVINKDHSLT